MIKRIFLYVIALLLCLDSTSFAENKDDNATFKSLVSNMNEVVKIRYASNDEKIRIVVDTSTLSEYKTMWLDNPNRLIIDVQNAWLSSTVEKAMNLNSKFASKLRIAQFDSKTVRIVIETEMYEDQCNIFLLPGGRSDGRIVIDLGGEVEPILNIENKDQTPKSADKVEDKKSADDKKSNDTDKPTKKEYSIDLEEIRRRFKDKTADDILSKQIEEMLSLKGKIIAIDPGHGGSDAGAIGPSGLMEKTVTLNIGLALREILEAEGATVIMTRETDKEVHEKGSKATANEELQARCDIANAANSSIFISIHIDSFSNDTAHGTTGYYDSDSKHGFKLADAIRKDLIDQIGTASRGTQPCRFYVVTHSNMPATLVEVAFISNPEEEYMLGSEEGIMLSALGIADGISDFFE